MSGHVERINRTISSSQRIPRKERESVTIHARCDTHACENTHIWRCRGGRGEGGGGGRRYIRLVDVIKREDKFGTSTRINSV